MAKRKKGKSYVSSATSKMRSWWNKCLDKWMDMNNDAVNTWMDWQYAATDWLRWNKYTN